MLSKLSSRISQSLGLGAGRAISTAPQQAQQMGRSNSAGAQAIIGMLANDLSSANHYTIHYQYLKQKEVAEGNCGKLNALGRRHSDKNTKDALLYNKNMNQPLSLDLLQKKPELLNMIALNAKFNFCPTVVPHVCPTKYNLNKEENVDAMVALGREASRLLNITARDAKDAAAAQGRDPKDVSPSLYHIRHWFENINIPTDLYVKNVEFDDVNYKRNVMYRDENLEILMLCWKPGQVTPVHDHPNHGCLVRVLEGEMFESMFHLGVNYEKGGHKEKQHYYDNGYPDGSLKVMKQRRLGPGAVSFLEGDRGVHRLQNSSPDRPALSLHMYAPPLYKPTPMLEEAQKAAGLTK